VDHVHVERPELPGRDALVEQLPGERAVRLDALAQVGGLGRGQVLVDPGQLLEEHHESVPLLSPTSSASRSMVAEL